MEAKFDTLVVITPKDCIRLLKLYPRLAQSIGYGNICFVGAPEISDVLAKSEELCAIVKTIDENSIIPFDDVHQCIERKMAGILAGRELPRGITGWYYQQFLKMEYSNICKDDYYMVWDGDTIPCKNLNMFHSESGKPYLDLKHEYHGEYFETMGKILPGFGKVIERSFISEHMLIRADIMRNLICDIEKNDAIPGNRFWEKIINSIPEEKIQDSAFSEFETYGTYVALKYQSVYKLREWHSFRLGGEFFDYNTISERDFNWLSKDFDAISFEKGHSVRADNANLFDNPYYQEKLTPKQMLQAAQLEYKEGYKEVWGDDEIQNANQSAGSFSMSDDVVPESRLKYLNKDAYKVYEDLGDKLLEKNKNQAYLCYENSLFLCDDPGEKERVSKKLQVITEKGEISVNKVAIVILSYNNTYYIQRCIESIYTNCNPDSYLLIIFDNGSTDGTAQWLAEWGNKHDEVLIILNEENMGFAAGNNEACQYVPKDHDIFFINNDTRVPANALFWLRMALYESNEIGGAGAVQNYAYADQLEDVKFDLPELYVEYGAKYNVPKDSAYEEQVKICGFAMLLRREAWDKSGGFDAGFSPAYFEDDDLCYRIREFGYRFIVCHNAFIYHVGSQGIDQFEEAEKIAQHNREVFINKWGFDTSILGTMSVNELGFVKRLGENGYTQGSRFSLVHIGCGCGNMLGRIHYLYPCAELYGVEPNDVARKFAIYGIHIFKSLEELPIGIDKIDIVVNGLG
jgi:GT2 family glycosyltransferase